MIDHAPTSWEASAGVRPYSLQPANGDLCFRLPDGRLGCSARDPMREARRRCVAIPAGARPVLLGLGAGHDLDALLERRPSEVLVVELDDRCLATAAERWRRLGLAGPDAGICRLVVAEDERSLCAILSGVFDGDHTERPVLVGAHCAELWRGAAPAAADLVDDLRRRRMSACRQEGLLAANEVANRDRLLQATGISEVAGIWGDDPVLVCGAGPGLDDALRFLSRDEPLALRVIGVSTALPPMLDRRVRPDVVVATDPSPLLAADLPPGARLEGVPLAVFPGTSAGLVAAWRGPIWLALPEGPGLHEEVWENRRPGRLLAGCGTVAGPALALAALASRGRLLLAGVDLKIEGAAYAGGVRRPFDLPRPDFAFARRRMVQLVQELEGIGRTVECLGERADWLPPA